MDGSGTKEGKDKKVRSYSTKRKAGHLTTAVYKWTKKNPRFILVLKQKKGKKYRSGNFQFLKLKS